MTASTPPWIIVSDFDGTLCEKDIGNELCKETIPELFTDLQGRYRREEISLRALQEGLWSQFPLEEKRFRERSVAHATLRPGVLEFLKACQDKKIPVYVASCGIRTYIDSVLDALIPPSLRFAITEVHCNDVTFGPKGVIKYTPPDSDKSSPYPLDKGALSLKLKQKHSNSRVYGIGNGSSDRSFWPHVDRLAATEGLAQWCTQRNIPFQPFHDFRDLMNIEALR